MLCYFYKELINFENPDSKKFICTQTKTNCKCGGDVNNCDFHHQKEDKKKEKRLKKMLMEIQQRKQGRKESIEGSKINSKKKQSDHIDYI